MKSNIFKRMSAKTKIILISTLILIAVILSAFIYIFLTYGAKGVYLTVMGIIFIGVFLFIIYLEAKYPRRKISSLERAERERAYQQEVGRQQAKEDYKRYLRDKREYEKRRKREEERFPWEW